MGIDQEPPASAENNDRPPFLTDKEMQIVEDSFNYGSNFNVINPPGGEPYLVITVPEQAQPFVDRAFAKSKEAAFNTVKRLGVNLEDPALSEDDRKEGRQFLSGAYLQILQEVEKLYFNLTLLTILNLAETGAELNALRAINDSTTLDSPEQKIDLTVFMRKENTVKRFLNPNPMQGRYILYSGDKVIYKTPPDLENQYSPPNAARQN